MEYIIGQIHWDEMGCQFAQCEMIPQLESGWELYEFFWESSTQCSYQCSNVLPVSWELDEGKIVADDHDRMIKVITELKIYMYGGIS